jgi:hypothetical protein
MMRAVRILCGCVPLSLSHLSALALSVFLPFFFRLCLF